MELADIVGKRITHIVQLDVLSSDNDASSRYLLILDSGATCEVVVNAIFEPGNCVIADALGDDND